MRKREEEKDRTRESKREKERERIKEQREVERDIYSERQIARKTQSYCVRVRERKKGREDER